jgi:hypothetical protein
MLSIFDIVENSGSIIYGDRELGFIISWNGSATFQWFTARNEERNQFAVVDIRTAYGIETLKQAEAEAVAWVEEEFSPVE